MTSNRTFQDISASLVSLFNRLEKNEYIYKALLVWAIILWRQEICSSGLDIRYDPLMKKSEKKINSFFNCQRIHLTRQLNPVFFIHAKMNWTL